MSGRVRSRGMTMSEEMNVKKNFDTPQTCALTAIARKENFLQHLQDFLDTHKTEKWCVAAIDVEHFRLYNELYGTEQGNTLLNILASHLLDYQKTSGCPVGYWGNDDFFLCLPDDRVQQQDIVITLQTCVSPNHQDVTFFLALGLCPVSEHPEADAATLCNYAQIAVMNPDHSGSGIHRFAPAMLDSLKAQQQLLSELEHALDNHEFTFFLQPKCNSMTRAIVGMEALVRWNHPTRGCVPPAEFMPLLERTGLVTRLDQYIWESVCQTLQNWQANGSNLVPVSVNVSVVDIVNLDVPQIFSDLVEKYQLEPKLLLAEITETMLAENSSVVENAIQGLHRKGFVVMMDDFGSGYSSLNVLKDVQVDMLKMDMMFMFKAKYDGRAETIISSVIRMAKWLNIPVIAEGVDRAEQVEFLKSVGCDYIQGFYYSKPLPAADYEKLISDQEEQPVPENGASVNDLLWGKSGGLLAYIDSIDQPATIYECFPDSSVVMVCSNKAFSQKYGYGSSIYGKLNVKNCIDSECKEKFTSSVNKAIESKDRAECVLSMHEINGKKHWFKTHLRFVSETGVSSVLIAYFTDVTDMVLTDKRINEYKNYIQDEIDRKHKILIVSNNSDTCCQLEEILSQENTVFTAETIQAGKKLLLNEDIDLIYFDIQLISKDDEFPLDIDERRLPVIAITQAHSVLKGITKLKNRVSDFVMKPYIDELVRLRTNNLLTKNILAERNDLKKSSAISGGFFYLIKLSALLTKYTLSDII